LTETPNGGTGDSKVYNFEEYSLFIEDTARLSDRRQTASNTYVAVNSLFLLAIGILIKDSGATGVWRLLLPVPLIISGILISKSWREILSNYKIYIGFRISVLREMEKKMSGIEKMFHREDALYTLDPSYNRPSIGGVSFSKREDALPNIFILLYYLFGLGIIIALIINFFASDGIT
jgi:hypothetical protein